ncbi:hypothetical protein DAI22_08g194122 [Oryza sativa Japonica Group]|nr:hypothetical protein DAI22_08g194122 [Oryza sativa Japonica Group]
MLSQATPGGFAAHKLTYESTRRNPLFLQNNQMTICKILLMYRTNQMHKGYRLRSSI